MSRWVPMKAGSRITCDCGDDQCWKGIEVLPNSLIVYEDISDVHFNTDYIVVNVPRTLALCQVDNSVVPSLEELSEDVTHWAKETFPKQGITGIINHLRREVLELEQNIGSGEEMADVFLLLAQLAKRQGIDLRAEVQRKFEKNQMRTWGEMDKDGVVSHIGEMP